MSVLYLIYAFFVLYVLVQMMSAPIALIDILLTLAPIALGLWILPHTANWGRQWLRTFMLTVFQQAVQLIALALGFGFLNEFAAIAAFEAVQDLIWKLLLSMAFIYMAGRVPSLLGNGGTFDAWLRTLYFGMSLPNSIMRSSTGHRADRQAANGGRPRRNGGGSPRRRWRHRCTERRASARRRAGPHPPSGAAFSFQEFR